jgi:hypothetical protein
MLDFAEGLVCRFFCQAKSSHRDLGKFGFALERVTIVITIAGGVCGGVRGPKGGSLFDT